ncbi:MAG TPA: serine acetyltransferase [Paludibacteraceae bacterium]|nr:serine acetyltransferase [Paludibacteraceae bacterium]HQB69578.1 serine acetyltransferase [Paludibacteraceae bacterium]HRS68138.1 serine acetyltransferase [Paludibacteraceae bacterium]
MTQHDVMKKAIAELSNMDNCQALCYQQNIDAPIPNTTVLGEIVDMLRSILFPGYFGSLVVNPQMIQYQIGVRVEELNKLLAEQIYAGICFTDHSINLKEARKQAKEITIKFIARLPELRAQLGTDVEATYKGDPAAQSCMEVIFCYPVIRAITNYRIAHELLILGVPLIPRIITELAHSETGIDIHPGATIGNYFTIDHGTGTVIGETSIIGNHVKIYQGVTLGAKSFPLDENGNPIKGIARHPVIEDNVIIYSNSTILGRITIGKNAIIGGNVWVDTDVPTNGKISQKGKL